MSRSDRLLEQSVKRRTVHEDVNEKNLHSIQRIAETEHGAERNECKGGDCSTELESKEVLDIVEDGFPYSS